LSVIDRKKSAPYMALLAVLLAVTGCRPEQVESRRPDALDSVLLVTIDTLRADHLSSYGYWRPTSPNFDAFVAGGARFEYAFSTSPHTAPSHASLMTGLYPSFHSVDVANSRYPLEPFHVTLAEELAGRGLATYAVVSNPVLSRRLGLDQGFDHYDDRLPGKELNRDTRERVAESAVDAALEVLQSIGDRSYFFWLHFQDPHGPYTPPDEFVDLLAVGSDTTVPESGKTILEVGENHSGYLALPRYQRLGDERRLDEFTKRYDAEIRYWDQQFGRVLEVLNTTNLLDRTLVVFTADHGEAFGEDGFYCAHGHGLGLDQTRVPLAVVGPGVRPNTVFEGAVSNLDVYATVLEALGGPQAELRQSRSLWSALKSGAEPEPIYGYAESSSQRAIFHGGIYLRHDRRPLSDTEFWAQFNRYTLARRIPLGRPDIHELETHETAAGQADGTLDPPELLAALSEFGERADRSRARLQQLRQERTLSPGELDDLRALGYVD
jgi:arylsulfatase